MANELKLAELVEEDLAREVYLMWRTIVALKKEIALLREQLRVAKDVNNTNIPQ